MKTIFQVLTVLFLPHTYFVVRLCLTVFWLEAFFEVMKHSTALASFDKSLLTTRPPFECEWLFLDFSLESKNVVLLVLVVAVTLSFCSGPLIIFSKIRLISWKLISLLCDRKRCFRSNTVKQSCLQNGHLMVLLSLAPDLSMSILTIFVTESNVQFWLVYY